MHIFSVFIDITGIQNYIFSTNKLKENLGASFIIADYVFNEHLHNTLKEIFPDIDSSIFNSWREQPCEIRIHKDKIPFEIGYVGGGNALFLFRDKEKAITFIKKWTSNLLVCCPGLQCAVALDSMDLSRFRECMENLIFKISKIKRSHVSNTIIPTHGITAECPHTGHSMEIWCNKLPKEEQKYISSISYAKIEAAEKAKKSMERFLDDLSTENGQSFRDIYTFTDNIEELGQIKQEDSHIAIVHIDGNDTTLRFKDAQTLEDTRKLSISLAKATEESLKALFKEIHKNIEDIAQEFEIHFEGDKKILPIRPIVVGGDDIIFICDGRLGLYFTNIFLENFSSQKVSDSKPISASAGVSVTKTKYPFYRGHELAESLLREAKGKRKKSNDNGSWIDFHLQYGGTTTTLKEYRKRHYTAPQGSLLLRPYRLDKFKELICAAYELKTNLPRSKIMELRNALYLYKDSEELFLRQIKNRGKKLPAFEEFTGNKLFIDRNTPYLDMIEMIELYPEFALKSIKGGKNGKL